MRKPNAPRAVTRTDETEALTRALEKIRARAMARMEIMLEELAEDIRAANMTTDNRRRRLLA